jgi:class 3 adenylate cyclase/tetratricopeptide (TPR) repeat protein
MECSQCQFENPEGMNFCGKCGQLLSDVSVSSLPDYANRSPKEYTPQFLLEKILANPSALLGERKHVTVFFADVVRFTTLSENLDPEDVHDIMDGCFEILGQEIHGAGGAINQYTGDGVMALFGAPIAYEDHIHRGCHAALRIQNRMKGYTRDVKKRYGMRFQMRIGMNAGTVVVGAIGNNLRLDYTAIGDTTNLAARLEALAPPGGILVSSAVNAAGEGFFLFHPKGDLEIKGKKAPVTVFSLERELNNMPSWDAKAAEIPFVNRKKELTILMQACDTMLQGRFQMAAVDGEAGVGKSRLFSAFQDAVQNEKILFLKAQCRPYGEATALCPVAGMFRDYFGITDRDSFERIRHRIKEKIKYRDLIPRIEKIFELFGVIRNGDPSQALFEGEKRRMFRAIADLVGNIITHRPLVMVFDDMQWIDQTTLDFLSFLAQAPIRGPLLAVCSGRYAERNWCPEITDYFVHLEPLDHATSLNLFRSVLGTGRLGNETSEKIVRHAAGNPLFLIEMAETIKKRNLLVCDSQICRLRLNVGALEIPQTIRGVLAARLDALPGSVKQIAQLAAVVGTEFSHDVLADLTGDTGRLNQGLKLLEQEGIIERMSSESGGRYLFHHQMMQEIAYQQILKKNRRQFHGKAGIAIEKQYRDNLTKQSGLLAYHFYRAHDWQKALAYTLEAGDQARRSFACGEALMCFDRALDILEKGKWGHHGKKALQIYKWKGGMHFCLGQMKESHRTFQKMLTEAGKLKDSTSRGEALFRLGWTDFFAHKPLAALNFLQKAIDLAQAKDIREIMLKATSFQGFIHSVLGDLKSPFFHIVLHFRKGLIYGGLGRLNAAEKTLQAGLKHLAAGDEKFWKPRFLNTLGWIRSEAGEIGEALQLNQEALQLALPTRDPETIHNAETNLGENYLQTGDLESAGEILNQVRNRIKHKRYLYAGWRYRTRLLIALADLHGKSGEHQTGLKAVNQALRMARKNGAAKHEARALQVKAGIIFESRPKIAQSCLERALEISSEMGAQRLFKRISKTTQSLSTEVP